MKKIIALVLLCALVLCLCACGISEDDAIGAWSGSYTYNGNSYACAFVLSADYEYVEVMYKNGSYYKTENGTWEIKKGDVILHPDGESSYMVFEYKDGSLFNGEHEYTKAD